MSYLATMSHGISPADKRKGSMEAQANLEYDPNRSELIVLAFRDSLNSKRATEMKLMLPSRYALAFHWWMVSQGIAKA